MERIGERSFIPHDIVLRDNALHNKEGFSHIETFYFDAVFHNQYSIVSLINIFKIGSIGLVLTGMFIYKDANLVKSKRERLRYHHLTGSEKEPHIMIHNKDIIRATYDKTNMLRYMITMGDDHDGCDLQFLQKTTAWKGKTALGNWLAIPRFNVQGTLYLDGETIPVTGGGYHDHNIYPFHTPFFNRGYHFGKFSTDSLDITWARVIKNRTDEKPIVVINNGLTYHCIDPKDITFHIEDQIKNNKRMIPKTWRLILNNKRANINVLMETQNVHHIGLTGLHYWRSHFKVTGKIHFDALSEIIDSVEISEYLRFF